MLVNSVIEEEFLKKLTEITEANMTNEQFGVSELAREMGMSRSNLHRKVIVISKNSVSQFIRQHRLKRAMEMLQHSANNVSEVAFKVGFGSVSYFTKCFHDYYGFPPGEAGKRNLADKSVSESTNKAKQATGKKRLKPILLHVTLISIILAAVLFTTNNPLFFRQNNRDKTIAVLPFANYSPDGDDTYMIDGLQEEILDKLEKIKDLKVKSRISVQKYRDTKLSIREIGKALKVKYILEGSGQMVEGTIRIRLQLIDALTGNHLWSKPYEAELNAEILFEIQEEIALSVANELEAIITPEEKELVTKRPTKNVTAYNLYLRGVNYLNLIPYHSDEPSEELIHAQRLFEQAIKLDTTFAEAYVRLGNIYNDYFYYTSDIHRSNQYLDSIFIVANKALMYDENNAGAYLLKGQYYYKKGMKKEADEAYLKIKTLPGPPWYYYHVLLGRYYNSRDNYNSIQTFYRFRDLDPPEETLFATFDKIQNCFAALGYPEISKKYCDKIIKQTNDSARYYERLNLAEFFVGNYKLALKYALLDAKIDTSLSSLCLLVNNYLLLRDYSQANQYLTKIETQSKHLTIPVGLQISPTFLYLSFGYIHLMNGQITKSNYYFNSLLEKGLDNIELNRLPSQKFYTHFYFAGIYATRGQKKKALEYLRMVKSRETCPAIMVTYLKYWPLFDNIRNEPEFADILNDLETKYQKAHEYIGELIRKKEIAEHQ
ncbi:MAG: helix-turn-helix domain-containing protein [Prolixibacteraceae bacterium]|nr:helix-turn-helix domain-containing protein [Prolixibacteraceae bacterium]